MEDKGESAAASDTECCSQLPKRNPTNTGFIYQEIPKACNYGILTAESWKIYLQTYNPNKISDAVTQRQRMMTDSKLCDIQQTQLAPNNNQSSTDSQSVGPALLPRLNAGTEICGKKDYTKANIVLKGHQCVITTASSITVSNLQKQAS